MRDSDAWFELHQQASGRCTICGKRKVRYNGGIDLVIDHCHRCLMVRGFICHACNCMGDGEPAFQAYSLNCPAKQLGITLLYPKHKYLNPVLRSLRCGVCQNWTDAEVLKRTGRKLAGR